MKNILRTGSLPSGLGEGAAWFLLSFGLHFVFALSGVFFKEASACFYNDAWVLHRMAENLLDRGMLSYMADQPTLFQMPFVPALIALVYTVAGRDPRWVLLLQMVLSSALLAYFVCRLRSRLGGWRILAGGLLGVDLHMLLYPSCLLPEFWLCAAWMMAALAFMDGVDRGGWRPFASFYVWLALAVWIKPLASYFAPALTLGLFVVKPGWALKNFRYLLGGLLLYILLLQPLLYRNWLVCGQYPRLTTISSFSYNFFNIPYFESIRRGISVSQARTERVNLMIDLINEREGRHIEHLGPEIACGLAIKATMS
ncbi:MAG: glycosyltransferase family 39 protein, partial [Planctomycetes bacterium]|nr:glycosyltransferase family 39 protein [Planctomycetota bacterium]